VRRDPEFRVMNRGSISAGELQAKGATPSGRVEAAENLAAPPTGPRDPRTRPHLGRRAGQNMTPAGDSPSRPQGHRVLTSRTNDHVRHAGTSTV